MDCPDGSRVPRAMLRTSLLLVLSGNAGWALADDSFIKQPKLAKQVVAEQTTVAAADTAIAPSTANTQPKSPVANAHPTPLVNPSQTFSAREFPQTHAAGFPAEHDSDLRWTSRSTAGASRIANGSMNLPSGSPGAKTTLASTVRPPVAGSQTSVPVAAASHINVQDQRQTLASLVSSRIMGGIQKPSQPRVQPIDQSPGWQAIGERLTLHLQEAEKLLRKKAILSSRAESEAAALYLARTLDLATNSYRAEPQWQAAEQALRESRDFHRNTAVDNQALRRIVDSHRTPVLKLVDLSNVSPLVAAQHYQQFAFEQLVSASHGHPWASEVFCMLGRTYQAEAESGGETSDELRSRTATYYRVAVEISPENTLAANQLGYLLLKMDRPTEALQTLVKSLKVQPSEPALENVIEAARRLGDEQLRNWAMQQLTSMRSQRPQMPHIPPITEVDVQTFMSLSPKSLGPAAPPQGTVAPLPAGAAANGTTYTAGIPQSYR